MLKISESKKKEIKKNKENSMPFFFFSLTIDLGNYILKSNKQKKGGLPFS